MFFRGSCISILLISFVFIDTPKSAYCHRRFSFHDDDLVSEEERNLDWQRDTANKEADSFGYQDAIKTFAMKDRNIAKYLDRLFSLGKQSSYRSVDPPPVDQPALMGRFIVNQADWTAVATISTRDDINTFPIANVISVSDGPLGNGTGIPYMYLTPLDFTAQDLARDHRATLLMSLAQGSYCKGKDMDPMDPRCARILLAGTIQEVKNSSSEYEVAKSAVFERHPWLAHMPANHHFFFAKLDIISVVVLDTFGGPKYVTVEDYMNPPSSKNVHKHRSRPFNNWWNENSIFESEERKFVVRV